MTCEERRDALFLLAAEELDAPERDELRAHLADGCPRCLGALAESQAAVARLALEIPPVEPPETVRRALAARISLETRLPELRPLEAPAAPARTPAPVPATPRRNGSPGGGCSGAARSMRISAVRSRK